MLLPDHAENSRFVESRGDLVSEKYSNVEFSRRTWLVKSARVRPSTVALPAKVNAFNRCTYAVFWSGNFWISSRQVAFAD